MAINRLRNNTIIILDSNALFMPFQFNLNLDSEFSRLFGDYEIIIPQCIISELRGLARTEKFGSSALQLALNKSQPHWYSDFESELNSRLDDTPELPEKNKTDQLLIKIAKEINGIVVTNDKALLSQLYAEGIRTISLYGKKYLKLNEQYNSEGM